MEPKEKVDEKAVVETRVPLRAVPGDVPSAPLAAAGQASQADREIPSLVVDLARALKKVKELDPGGEQALDIRGTVQQLARTLATWDERAQQRFIDDVDELSENTFHGAMSYAVAAQWRLNRAFAKRLAAH